jgi:hypothetical protein
MQEEQPIFGNSGIKIILIEKKEYYLIYEHDNIPHLNQEKYDNIIRKKEEDINLGTIILYDKQKTKDGKYTKITPIYKSINKKGDEDMDIEEEKKEKNKEDKPEEKEGILMTDAINLNLLESDFNLLNKVMMILEGRNSSNLLEKTPVYYNFPYLNNKNNINQNNNNSNNNKENNVKKSNNVLKIDFNEKKLKIISIVNKGINMILFSIDIKVEYILDLTELLDISIKNFKNKTNLMRNIDKSFNTNLKTIDELNLKKTTMIRKNKEKSEKLMNFIISELNKKKKNNFLLNEKINSLFTAQEDDKKNKNDKIDEDKDEDKESDISLGSIAAEDEKNLDDKNINSNNNNSDEKIYDNNNNGKGKELENNNNNEENMNNDELNDSNLSLTDL